MPTTAELLTHAMGILGEADASSRLDAEVLLAHALSRPRSHLLAWPDHPVPGDQAERYQSLVDRRAGGEPVAYLTGMREFWSLMLEVTPETLIPRPDTERLVEVALTLVAEDEPAAVADLGTGTGNVAAAIATERPRCRVVATDASAGALAVAARNVDRLGLRNVSLRRGDWCSALSGDRFSLIVSNPPYVRSGDAHLERGDVRFEPPSALSAGVDGLEAIRAIAADAAGHLLPGAALALEHGHDQGPAVRALLEGHGYRAVATYRDLAGHERVSVGRRLSPAD